MMKILIVDRDPEMLEQMGMLIRSGTPYEQFVTDNVFEAMEQLKKGGLSLVIAGTKMPVFDGVEFFEVVKKFDREVPVIVISSYGNVATAMEAMRKGCFEFIMSPFRQEQILFAVHNAIEMSELKKENELLRKQTEVSWRVASGVL